MNFKSFLTIVSCTAALSFGANAIELVFNGNFEQGTSYSGSSPFGWSAPVNPTGTGQFIPNEGSPGGVGGALSPLSGRVAYMNDNVQILQTFSIGLAANTIYTIKFDSYLSIPDSVPPDTLSGSVSYGTGSGGSSAFASFISLSDVASGSTDFTASLTPLAQSYEFSFTTPSVITGSTDNLAIFLNANLTNIGEFEQLYLDNVSVTTSAVPEPSTWAMLGAGLCALVFVRRCKLA